MSKETITITREQFVKAVSKASDKFMAIGEDVNNNKKDAMTLAIMGMQNMMFGSLIAKVLFEESEDK